MCRPMMSVVGIAMVLIADCHAQFIDDFNGNSLAPHWELLQQPGCWVYQVDGGLLHVQELLCPSFPKASATNYQRMHTEFVPVFGDFVATALMGWAPGSLRSISVSLAGTQGGLLGAFTYSELMGPNSLVLRTGFTGSLVFPAPSAGLHEFMMARSGNQMSFFIDGTHVTTLPEESGEGVRLVRLGFDVLYPDGVPMNGLMVDRVAVVPSPGTSLMFLVLTWGCASRRRR